MKRVDQLSHLRKLNLADLQKEIRDLEQKIQAAKLGVAFGKNKNVAEINKLRKQLARTLTVGNQMLGQPTQGEDK